MTPVLPRLGCAELARSLRFYTDVLGFALLEGGVEQGWAGLARDGAELVLEQAGAGSTGPLEYPHGRGLTLQVAVPDAEELYAAVLAYGGRIHRPLAARAEAAAGQDGPAATFEVMDPDGYLFRFVDAPADALDPSHGTAHPLAPGPGHNPVRSAGRADLASRLRLVPRSWTGTGPASGAGPGNGRDRDGGGQLG
jgi:catechol 2,3-dioxygenase-like lactoylglutathione lyase family enzyme